MTSSRFHRIRAVIVHHTKDLPWSTKQSLSETFWKIGVNLVSLDDLKSSEGTYDVLGLLCHNSSANELKFLRNLSDIKIGFCSRENSRQPAKVLHGLNAKVICHDALNAESALQNNVYHFFECITTPSLLNIDLSDVRSLAKGVGLSFYCTGNSAQDIIDLLPREISAAKSALLHFGCTKDVTLEELHSISKSVALKHRKGLERKLQEIDHYRTINLKMGVRLKGEAEEVSAYARSRISLTAILFGV